MADTTELQENITLTIDGKEIALPIVSGSYDEKGLDIGKLRKLTGQITLDPGFKNTGSTRSAITYIDGEAGVLLHRGYPIEQLADEADFPELIHLVLNTDLPTQEELSELTQTLQQYYEVPGFIKDILNSLPPQAHPMGTLSTLISALPAAYPDSLDSWSDESVRWKTMYRLIGHMPTLVAYIYRRYKGLPYIEPDPTLGYVANFMYMMKGEVNEKIAEAFDTLLILHTDHEQNCSASTVRLAGSSHVNLFAAVAAGNGALWGPLHGGANQAVLEMLDNIQADGGGTQKYLAKAKDKSDPFRLMGFGHRVYKNYDPRARVIKKYVNVVLEQLNLSDPVLSIAKSLEEEALNDPYFVDRKLFPNVDFYSGIIYKALGIPVDMFTVMFALGRLPGWIAQWKEMRETGDPIGRPRQIYIGERQKDFVPISSRS
ncbi:MAG: citrate synthase [Bacteroidota bacterium]